MKKLKKFTVCTNTITKILNNQGNIKIESKVNEDLDMLEMLDGYFKKKRGYIVKMPEKGSSVVASFGGQDSVTNIGILIEEFGLHIYPLLISRGQSNYKYEKHQLNTLTIYKKRYPKLYNDYVEINVPLRARSTKIFSEKPKESRFNPSRAQHFLPGQEPNNLSDRYGIWIFPDS